MRCESATPLGSPSVPEVNRITAGVACGGPRRHHAGQELAHCRERLVEDRQLFAHVFEIDDLGRVLQFVDQRLEFAQLDEFVRGDDALDLRHVERRFDRRGAGREIEHGGHAAIGRDREERDHRARAGRQHHADRFAVHGFRLCSA